MIFTLVWDGVVVGWRCNCIAFPLCKYKNRQPLLFIKNLQMHLVLTIQVFLHACAHPTGCGYSIIIRNHHPFCHLPTSYLYLQHGCSSLDSYQTHGEEECQFYILCSQSTYFRSTLSRTHISTEAKGLCVEKKCMRVSLCVCLCVSVHVCMRVFVGVCMHVCVFVSV